MAGPRFVDWSHIRVVGDRHAAAAYVSEARKLMGYVQEDAARRGLGVHTLRRELSDGTVIIAEKHGDIPRMTIIPVPPGGARRRLEVIEQFIPWARTEEQVEGIDGTHPQQMLRPDDSGWRTLFFDSGIDGYDDFDRKKGAYRTEGGVDVFPNGVRHAGNLDWRSEDGQRVSWYGPSSRYWFDPYVQPRSQYGQKVFMLGQEIYDALQYQADSDEWFAETWVLGAALEDRSTLLLIQTELPVFGTPDFIVPRGTSYAEAPVARFGDPLPMSVVLCRYKLSNSPADPTKFSVSAESREVIAATTLDAALCPFFFNESATEAVSCLPPKMTGFGYFSNVLNQVPQAESSVATVTTDGDWATRQVTCAPGGAGVIAADWKGDALVEAVVRRTLNNGGGDDLHLEVGGRSWPLRTVHMLDTAQRSPQQIQDGHLLYADLRSDTVLLHENYYSGTNVAVTFSRARVALYCGDSVAAEDYTHDLGYPGGLPRTLITPNLYDWQAFTFLAGVPMAPQVFLYLTTQVEKGTVVVELRWAGRHAGLTCLPFRAEHYFGGYGPFSGTEARPVVPVASNSDATAPLDDEDDFDGHQSVLGCAGYEGVAVASTYAPRFPFGAAANIVAGGPEPGISLGDLTGVEGTNPRYHPVWLLGTLPNTEAA